MDRGNDVHKYIIFINNFCICYINGKPFCILGTKNVDANLFCEQKIALSNEFFFFFWVMVIVIGCTNLDKTVCEGICEAIGHQWLDWFCDKENNSLESYTTGQTQFTRKLKPYLACKMAMNPNQIYGHGFREAKWAVSEYNLRKTLQHIV